jgi:alkylhydroperoxidase family enzyme
MIGDAGTPGATARVKLVTTPASCPGLVDPETKAGLDTLFAHMFPQSAKPEIPGGHAVFAVIAQSPKLALLLVKINQHISAELRFTDDRPDPRELVAQAVCHHFKCDYSFTAHLCAARPFGTSPELQALIPFWKTTSQFSAEQRLLIEYTFAVTAGNAPQTLFARVVGHFGEKIAIDCTVAIAWWSFWAMIANATAPQFDFELGSTMTN